MSASLINFDLEEVISAITNEMSNKLSTDMCKVINQKIYNEINRKSLPIFYDEDEIKEEEFGRVTYIRHILKCVINQFLNK